ncbi:PorV/PorQ family protein [candidate division KSB1 bacterium]|nr:PorV/PorQ family protein [candidate division KSB1 bacterium]NIT74596.1 PorV/PorQ family protein [candidate division KSB1 bacterium]NIU28415.1 PorV/PorQ family protein [candidate division KSB1 bacterium]NIU91652.1 PorV/PorQ family protein [candidate division KSB1 bacterium]NIV94095.1 PorV/PorQ family protein [candidate division KSB1 bacterium]
MIDKMLIFHKIFFRLVPFVYILFCINSAFSQGTTSLFLSGGAGARALAMGNANVAFAADPSVVFWNPAGLDFIQKKSASFYYTNLIEDANHSFIGFAYPTISIGGFGFGWIRIATGDIVPRDEFGVEQPAEDFSQNQFLFSYGKQIKENLSVGLSLKVETMNQIQNLSDSGIGADFGFLYRPVFDSGFLQELAFGVNIQNIIKPTMKLVNEDDRSPLNFKVGVAKPFYFSEGDERSSLTFLLDFNKSENDASKLNFGTEYAFREQAMVRLGFNDGQMTFGAGASISNFQFDYTFGKLFDAPDFSANHRFSITVELGKSKEELIEIARRKREREFKLRVQDTLWVESRFEFENNMESGREQYYKKEYLQAVVDFKSALQAATDMKNVAMKLRGKDVDDLNANIRVETAEAALQEAQTMFNLADAKSDSATQAQIKHFALQETQSKLEEELRNYVLHQRKKGDAFFKQGYFTQAIREWQAALDRLTQTDNGTSPKWASEIIAGLENSIEAAEKELAGNVEQAIRRADALARRGDYVAALNVLNDLISAGLSQEDLKKVNTKKGRYQSELTYQENYEEGVRSYENKDWEAAMAAFERVLEIRPNDAQARRYYEDAKARSVAKPKPMPPNVRRMFTRGVKFFREGKYKEALQIWEETRKEQPYNKTILDAIDRASEALKKKK